MSSSARAAAGGCGGISRSRAALVALAALLVFEVSISGDAACARGRRALYSDATRTGLYIGGFAAYSNFSAEVYDTDVATGAASDQGGQASRRPALGALMGYQWQVRDRFMVGIEGDLFFSEQNNRFASTINQPTGTSDRYQLAHWGTTRARVGFAIAPGVLLSATAGLAIVDFDFTDIRSTGTYHGSNHAYGWVLGGGLDYDLTESFRLRIDGLYADIGNLEITGGNTVHDVKADIAIVRSSLLWAY